VPEDGGGLQFVLDEPGPHDSADDVLELGAHRRMRPAALITALTLALVAAVVLAVVNGHSGASPRPVSVASRAPLPPPSSAPLSLTPPLDLSPPIEGTLLAVALGPTRRYVLTDQQLVVEDVGSGAELASASMSLPAIRLGVPTYQLALDATGDHLWIVPEDGTSSSVFELDAVDLQELGAVTVSDPIQGSAVLDGVLYLATSSGVRAVNAAAHTAPVLPGLAGDATGIAADPARDVLVIAKAGFPTKLVVIRPGSRVAVATASLQLAVGAIVVVQGQTWVQGYGVVGPGLVRLDASTLQPAQSVVIGAGATLVAIGTRVLWVRSGAAGTQLSCIDAVTGAVSQSFSAPAGVIVSQHLSARSRVGVALLATSGATSGAGASTIVPLALAGCAG
jgi:hypothetical protein